MSAPRPAHDVGAGGAPEKATGVEPPWARVPEVGDTASQSGSPVIDQLASLPTAASASSRSDSWLTPWPGSSFGANRKPQS